MPAPPDTIAPITHPHYWFHLGESQAVRQLLGHRALPTFVGEIGAEAPYIPEAGA